MARSLDSQEVVFRKPHYSASKKSGVNCVRNIEEMVVFQSKEYLDSAIFIALNSPFRSDGESKSYKNLATGV
jgi:hypothetical protein